MKNADYPVTQAVRVLRENKIDFTPYIFAYEEKGGTRHTARELNVDEHAVIKTLVMENDSKEVIIVLMHGDCEVSTKELSRQIGVKRIVPCEQNSASKNTGYVFGGTSPFGTKKQLRIFAEETIFLLDKIYINGGKQGFIVGISPADLEKALHPIKVNVAVHSVG